MSSIINVCLYTYRNSFSLSYFSWLIFQEFMQTQWSVFHCYSNTQINNSRIIFFKSFSVITFKKHPKKQEHVKESVKVQTKKKMDSDRDKIEFPQSKVRSSFTEVKSIFITNTIIYTYKNYKQFWYKQFIIA